MVSWYAEVVYGWLVMLLLILSLPQIVDKQSACLGLANEIAVGIAGANHWTMCQFGDINSQKYVQVWRAIERMMYIAGASSDSGM